MVRPPGRPLWDLLMGSAAACRSVSPDKDRAGLEWLRDPVVSTRLVSMHLVGPAGWGLVGWGPVIRAVALVARLG